MTKIQKLKTYFFIVIGALILPQSVFAASFFFDAPSREWRVGDEVTLSVFLNTEGADINAVSGRISYPAEILSLREIRDGNSIVNFWIDQPSVGTRNATNIDTNGNENIGLVVFSGITPGGHRGERGLLFSLLFAAREEGQGMIEIRETQALLNDGQGTETKSRDKNLSVSIGTDMGIPSRITLEEDIDPPSAFAPQIAQDPAIFDGKWFLVFATQDKGAGMSHFEIHESTRKKDPARISAQKWIIAESLYLLSDQALRSYIYVKAVDRAGNERVEIVEPRYPLKWYEGWVLWAIIIVVIAILLFRSRVAQIMSRFWGKKS